MSNNTEALSALEIDSLCKGDKVWQIGCRRRPDRELTVMSKGPEYITFTTTIRFVRAGKYLSNGRFIYRTREDMECAKVYLSQLEKITQILHYSSSSDRACCMDGVADLLTRDEVNSIYTRMEQRWPCDFYQEATNEQ